MAIDYDVPNPSYEPSPFEAYASLASLRVRHERILLEAGRGTVGWPKASDRYGGARHDYNKEQYKNLYLKIELIQRGINTTAQHATQVGFRVIGKNDDNNELIREWTEYMNYDIFLYDVDRHWLIYGDCFIEIVKESANIVDGWGIKELKLLDPDTMYVYAKENGDIIGYVQHPKTSRLKGFTPEKISDTTPDSKRAVGRKQKTWKELVTDRYPNAIVFDPEEIVHRKWNPMPSSNYGTSTIEALKFTLTIYRGMVQDLSSMIHRYGSPMIHWKVGTEAITISPKAIIAFSEYINTRPVGVDPVTSGIVVGDVLSAGEKAMDINSYIIALRNDLLLGIGVPNSVLGGITLSGQSASETELEGFSRRIGVIHQLLQDMSNKEIFPIVLGENSGSFTRETWKKIPRMIFNPAETIEQKYLRVGDGVDKNILAIEEARLELGYPGDIPDGYERAIDFQKELAVISKADRSINSPGTTGPSKVSTRDRDKTKAEEPSGEKPKEHK